MHLCSKCEVHRKWRGEEKRLQRIDRRDIQVEVFGPSIFISTRAQGDLEFEAEENRLLNQLVDHEESAAI